MKRRNHVLLLACACAFIGAEQLIMGALKGSKARAEATPPRRPTLNERLTALEGKFETLETRIGTLEGQKAATNESSMSTTELIETTTPAASTEMAMLSESDMVTTESPVPEEAAVSEIETNTPIVSLEDIGANLGMQIQPAPGIQEPLMLDTMLNTEPLT